MEAVNIPYQFRCLIFPLLSRCCCQTDILTVVTVDGVKETRQAHLTGRLPGWIEFLQIARMAGVVKTNTKTTSKVSARGKICMFACYVPEHVKD